MSGGLKHVDRDSAVPVQSAANKELDLFSVMDAGLIWLDANSNVLYYNSVLEELTCTDSRDVVGNNLQFLLSGPLGKYSSFFRQMVLAGDHSPGGPFKIIGHNGNLRYFSSVPLPYSSGKQSGTLYILRDETINTICSGNLFCSARANDNRPLPFVSFLRRADNSLSVEYVSDNVSQFGYRADDFISGRLQYSDIISPEFVQDLDEASEGCKDDCFSREYMILTSVNKPRWVLERSCAVRDENNNITHFHGTLLDIDEMKNLEIKFQCMDARRRALSRLGRKALSCTDINKLMNYATFIVADTLQSDYCMIMEKLSDERLLLRYGYGVNDLCIGSVIVDKHEGSPAGFVSSSGKPVIITDIETDRRFNVPRFLLEHDIISGAGIGIGETDNSFGVIFAYSVRKNHFSENDLNFLQSVSTILTKTIKIRKSLDSLQLYRKLIDRSNDYILVLDTVFKKFVYVSERVIRDLGYHESEIMERGIFHPECFIKAVDILDVIRRAADEGSFLVCSEFIRKNGTPFPVDISFSFVENEGKIYMVMIGRDVTEKKKALQILSESEAKLSTVFDNASDIICLSEMDGTILEVSGTMIQSMGYGENELIGMSVEDVTASEYSADISQLLDEIMQTGYLNVEIDILRKNGSSLPLEMKCRVIEYNGHKRLLSVGRDISERRLLEKAIKEHSEQLEYSNEIKNMFTDVTSHDLTSSVSLIEGFASYLSDIEEDEEKKTCLSRIVSGTEKLRNTIDSAAVFAKMNSANDMEIQTLDLRHLFHNSIERLLNEALINNIRLTLNSPVSCPAYANPIIEEVFFNLISNAIKYSPDNGEVVVDIVRDGEMWKISVSDNGPGISERDKAEIFKRFSRLGDSDICGKGLGLAIARIALKCHGQELHVRNNKSGKGTTFWFNVRFSDEFEKYI